MSSSAKIFSPGEKTHHDENFPVASYLISKKYRGAIMAFYGFARAADDIADNGNISESEKIKQLDLFEDTLLGKSEAISVALPLREEITKRGLSPRHAQDLLVAFRQDARQNRYDSWEELKQYCAYSAAPVGRFVLDVHGESPETWPASDALCSALQIINHLQDCRADYLSLNRIYLPRDVMNELGASEADLGATNATPPLRQVIMMLTKKTQDLLVEAKLAPQVKNLRLACEVAAITRLADRLLGLLARRDPLSEKCAFGQTAAGCRDVGRRTCNLSAPGIIICSMGADAAINDKNYGAAEPSARSSSFYIAMRIMPKNQRQAMFEIYHFCRAVDDIADDSNSKENKLNGLAIWRRNIEAIFSDQPPAHLEKLAEITKQFGLEKSDFLAVIDGMEMDVRGPVYAPPLATLNLYCDRVACAVGRLSVKVFGLKAEDGVLLSHHLGNALQLTNILRDIDEDAAIGRLYLPLELLKEQNIETDDLQAVLTHPALPQVCADIMTIAANHFAEADKIMQRHQRREVRTPRIMAEAYGSIYAKLDARGFKYPRAGIHLNKARICYILLRNMLF